jgi:hypothetical protein
MIQANKFKERAELMKLTKWRLRQCDKCLIMVFYWFKGEVVEVDSGCDCDSIHTVDKSSWEEVAAHYNSQTDQAVIEGMNRFWKFHLPGGVYAPSNGTEGRAFVESNCMACESCNPNPELTPQCDILAASMIHDYKDDEYPREWTFDRDNNPICTARLPWDWENNGNPDDPDGKHYTMPENEDQEELKL